jgi:hypothetical protein
MSLTITPIPDCQQSAGPSQVEKGFQLQPGTADYPSGGYVIPGALATGSNVIGNFGSQFTYGVDQMAENAAAAAYMADFILPAGSFGATPSPATTVTMQVGLLGVGAGIPLGLGTVSAAKSTTIGVASNVITVAIANNLVAGQFVYLQSFTAGGALNGHIVQVATASATGFTANYPTANITAATADTTGTYQLVQAGPGNLLTTGTSAAITNSLATASLLTMTCANSFTPGQFVVIQGLTNGAAANGVIAQILTASATQFTANWTGSSFLTGADVGTAKLLVTSGGAPVTVGTAFAISNSLATANSAGTAGVVTLTALNSLVPGNIVVIQGLTNGAGVNGDQLVVNAASLTSKLFVSNHINAGFTTAADSGTAALMVTGNPTGFPQVSPGTDLSACTWFASFLTGGM